MCKSLTMGHIKLYRKMQQWEWYGKPNMVALWVHLLLNANWEDNEWRGMTIKRGQLVTSINAIAVETGLSVSQVRSGLKNLQNSKQITCETTNQMTKVTICNYESYQSFDDSESQTKRKRNSKQISNPTSPEIATNKEDNKVNNENKKSGKEAEELIFPFTSERFMKLWSELCLQPKWKGKTIHALQLNLNDLARFDEEFACILMADAIKKNYQGIVYDSTADRYEKWKQSQASQGVIPFEPQKEVKIEYQGMMLSKEEYDAVIAAQRIIKGE